jgi:hypothetical protein
MFFERAHIPADLKSKKQKGGQYYAFEILVAYSNGAAGNFNTELS